MKARVPLNLPRSRKAAAEDRARRNSVSLDPFIACAPTGKAGARNAAAFLEKRGEGGDGDPERAVRWLEARPE